MSRRRRTGLIRVLATGTFDLLHPGHLMYLEQSRTLGDELVVIVARDANVKHKPKPIIPQDQRMLMVSALNMVDSAVLGSETDMFQPIEEFKPDIITLGYDQHFDSVLLKEELATRGIDARVVRLEGHDPCPLCSSRMIVAKVLEERCLKRGRPGPKD
jgi:FAD synthetase